MSRQPWIKPEDEEVSIEKRIASLREMINRRERELKDLKASMLKLARQKFETELGLLQGQEYDFRFSGKVYKGVFKGVSNKDKEPSLLMDVTNKNGKPTRWKISPYQIIGYEGIPKEEMERIMAYVESAQEFAKK